MGCDHIWLTVATALIRFWFKYWSSNIQKTAWKRNGLLLAAAVTCYDSTFQQCVPLFFVLSRSIQRCKSASNYIVKLNEHLLDGCGLQASVSLHFSHRAPKRVSWERTRALRLMSLEHSYLIKVWTQPAAPMPPALIGWFGVQMIWMFLVCIYFCKWICSYSTCTRVQISLFVVVFPYEIPQREWV